MRECHLCRVAVNTVWSRIWPVSFRQRWGSLQLLYTRLLYFTLRRFGSVHLVGNYSSMYRSVVVDQSQVEDVAVVFRRRQFLPGRRARPTVRHHLLRETSPGTRRQVRCTFSSARKLSRCWDSATCEPSDAAAEVQNSTFSHHARQTGLSQWNSASRDTTIRVVETRTCPVHLKPTEMIKTLIYVFEMAPLAQMIWGFHCDRATND